MAMGQTMMVEHVFYQLFDPSHAEFLMVHDGLPAAMMIHEKEMQQEHQEELRVDLPSMMFFFLVALSCKQVG